MKLAVEYVDLSKDEPGAAWNNIFQLVKSFFPILNLEIQYINEQHHKFSQIDIEFRQKNVLAFDWLSDSKLHLSPYMIIYLVVCDSQYDYTFQWKEQLHHFLETIGKSKLYQFMVVCTTKYEILDEQKLKENNELYSFIVQDCDAKFPQCTSSFINFINSQLVYQRADSNLSQDTDKQNSGEDKKNAPQADEILCAEYSQKQFISLFEDKLALSVEQRINYIYQIGYEFLSNKGIKTMNDKEFIDFFSAKKQCFESYLFYQMYEEAIQQIDEFNKVFLQRLMYKQAVISADKKSDSGTQQTQLHRLTGLYNPLLIPLSEDTFAAEIKDYSINDFQFIQYSYGLQIYELFKLGMIIESLEKLKLMLQVINSHIFNLYIPIDNEDKVAFQIFKNIWIFQAIHGFTRILASSQSKVPLDKMILYDQLMIELQLQLLHSYELLSYFTLGFNVHDIKIQSVGAEFQKFFQIANSKHLLKIKNFCFSEVSRGIDQSVQTAVADKELVNSLQTIQGFFQSYVQIQQQLIENFQKTQCDRIILIKSIELLKLRNYFATEMKIPIELINNLINNQKQESIYIWSDIYIIFILHKALFFRSCGNISVYLNTLVILLESNSISAETRNQLFSILFDGELKNQDVKIKNVDIFSAESLELTKIGNKKNLYRIALKVRILVDVAMKYDNILVKFKRVNEGEEQLIQVPKKTIELGSGEIKPGQTTLDICQELSLEQIGTFRVKEIRLQINQHVFYANMSNQIQDLEIDLNVPSLKFSSLLLKNSCSQYVFIPLLLKVTSLNNQDTEVQLVYDYSIIKVHSQVTMIRKSGQKEGLLHEASASAIEIKDNKIQLRSQGDQEMDEVSLILNVLALNQGSKTAQLRSRINVSSRLNQQNNTDSSEESELYFSEDVINLDITKLLTVIQSEQQQLQKISIINNSDQKFDLSNKESGEKVQLLNKERYQSIFKKQNPKNRFDQLTLQLVLNPETQKNVETELGASFAALGICAQDIVQPSDILRYCLNEDQLKENQIFVHFYNYQECIEIGKPAKIFLQIEISDKSQEGFYLLSFQDQIEYMVYGNLSTFFLLNEEQKVVQQCINIYPYNSGIFQLPSVTIASITTKKVQQILVTYEKGDSFIVKTSDASNSLTSQINQQF